MRKFVQTNCAAPKDYDPIARRGNLELDFNFTEKVSTKPSTCKESVTKAPSFLTSKPKSIPAPRLTNLKNDSMYSQRSGGSGSGQGGSTSNLFANLTGKENEILADLNNMIERQKADKNPQLEILRAERDFYYSKLRDIDHLLDVFTGTNVETLTNNIRELLYLTPEKIAIVCEDGDIKIRNKNESDMDAGKENKEDDDIIMMDIVNTASVAKDRAGKASQVAHSKEVMVIEDDSSVEEIPAGVNNSANNGHNMSIA